jgi:hypothetical protein
LLKIRGDIRKSRCIISINDTGGKFATGVNDAGGTLPPTSINDTSGKFYMLTLQPEGVQKKIMETFLIEYFFYLPPGGAL